MAACTALQAILIAAVHVKIFSPGGINLVAKRIIALTSGRPAGCTFLDWSLHWLAGHRWHWNFVLRDWVPVPQDPLFDQNAHAHQKNHPAGCQQLESMLGNYAATDRSDFATVYYNFQDLPHWLESLNISQSRLSRDHWHNIRQNQLQQLKDMSKICCANNVMQIVVTETPGTEPYFLHARVIADWMPSNIEPDISEYQTWFGVDANMSRWDLREQIALDIRPFEPTCFRDYIAPQCPHIAIANLDLWINGLDTIPKLMQKLDIALDKSRWQHWCEVYARWQKMQMPYVYFAQEVTNIVQDIVAGSSRVLPKFTLLQEATLQHCLIYLHDINLRNWQLDHFPTNTRELHFLLEPNRHIISDATYRDLLRRSIDSLALINAS